MIDGKFTCNNVEHFSGLCFNLPQYKDRYYSNTDTKKLEKRSEPENVSKKINKNNNFDKRTIIRKVPAFEGVRYFTSMGLLQNGSTNVKWYVNDDTA